MMLGDFRETLFQAYIRGFSARIIRVVGIITSFLILGSFPVTELFGEYFDPHMGERFGLYYEWRLLLCGFLLWMVLALVVSDWMEKYLNTVFTVTYVTATFFTSYYLMPIEQPNTTLRYLTYIIPFFTIITPAPLYGRTAITLTSLSILPGTYLALGWQPYFYMPLLLIITGISFVSITIGHYCFYRLNRKNFFQNRRLKQQSQELQRAKLSAEEANRKKNLFLANVTHDLRTPLNAIKGYADLLLEQSSSSIRSRKLNAIASASEDLNRLIDTLLDLSEIQLDDDELDEENVSLPEIFKDLRNLYSQDLREKPVELKLQFHENVPDQIIISETALKQIIFNLVDNAFKHTEKGHVKVELHGEQRQQKTVDLTITVEDTGVGMTDQQLDQIFNLFNQGGRQEVSDRGVGLGLFICQELIERMNGEITVSSDPGEGTTFTVFLPTVPITKSQSESTKSPKDDLSEVSTPAPDLDITPELGQLSDSLRETLRETAQDARERGGFEDIGKLADELVRVGSENSLQKLIDAGQQLNTLLDERSFKHLNQFVQTIEEQLRNG